MMALTVSATKFALRYLTALALLSILCVAVQEVCLVLFVMLVAIMFAGGTDLPGVLRDSIIRFPEFFKYYVESVNWITCGPAIAISLIRGIGSVAPKSFLDWRSVWIDVAAVATHLALVILWSVSDFGKRGHLASTATYDDIGYLAPGAVAYVLCRRWFIPKSKQEDSQRPSQSWPPPPTVSD